MNDEKEVQAILEIVSEAVNGYHDRFLSDKVLSRLKVALTSHGQSCYERGRREWEDNYNKKLDELEQVEKVSDARWEENQLLKERIKELEEKLADDSWRWEQYLGGQPKQVIELQKKIKELEEEIGLRKLAEDDKNIELLEQDEEITRLKERIVILETRIELTEQARKTLADRLANSWEKRTVKEVLKVIQENLDWPYECVKVDEKHIWSLTALATAIVKFMEEKRA